MKNTAASAAPALTISNVTKTFSGGSVTAVDDVSLTIPAGQIVALLGPNGAGKTTLFDMVLGFTTPDSGSITIHDGRYSPKEATSQGLIGTTLQTKGLLEDLTISETLRMVHGMMRRPLPLDEVIATADLEGVLDRKVGKASGGQVQRLRFGLAIMSDPEILLLDEPTTGMDTTVRRDFWDTMRNWTSTAGRTIIFATHYLPEAEQFAERIVLMSQGRIAADGTTRDLMRNQDKDITARWISASTDPHTVLNSLDIPITSTSFDPDTQILQIRSPHTDELTLKLLSGGHIEGLTITQNALEDIFTTLSTPSA